MKSFILALALFASTIGIAQITKAETGGREGDTPMGIIGTTIGIIRTTIGIIRNTFGIIRIGVITATDSGITTGDIGCTGTANTFFTRSTNAPAPYDYPRMLYGCARSTAT